MKKKLLIACMSLALIVSVVTVAYATPGASQFCKANGDFGLSHGACVSTVQACTPDLTGKCVCKLLKNFDLLELFGFNNHGQCVKAIG